MIVRTFIWNCCAWPSPCLGGCDGGWLSMGYLCECGAKARSVAGLHHEQLCPFIARTAPRGAP